MQPPGEGPAESEREREREEVERGCVPFFKGKPTLVSLSSCPGTVEHLNLSPSLTLSAVKKKEKPHNLGCLLCLSCALSLILFRLL